MNMKRLPPRKVKTYAILAEGVLEKMRRWHGVSDVWS
jgi:hypothetical protein